MLSNLLSSWLNHPEHSSKKPRQSPINIKTKHAIYNKYLKDNPLIINYDSKCFEEIKNNGRTFSVTGSSKESGYVTGGPMKTTIYKFFEFHMHWGPDDSVGSEHVVNGKQYPAELHFVHWNTEKYATPTEAMNSSDHSGLMVLSVLVEISDVKNLEFEMIIKYLNEIMLFNQVAKLSEADSLLPPKLLPSDLKSFWNYDGSLTTPPYPESVKWVVFKMPIQINSEQLSKFRNLYTCSKSDECSEKSRISRNFRPCCQLNNRDLHKSFI